MLRSIPQSSKAVLEVGCGTGALGAAYKFYNPMVNYAGVEFNPEAADLAAKVIDSVVCGDIEDPALILPGATDVIYDCLVYGDVLEHLKDPWTCLSRHLDILSENGVVVACIPNVQHWSVIMNLLTGQWPTVDQGLFDRTHLRWFTRDSICEWFESAGLHIYGIQPRIFAIDKAQDFTQKMIPALKNFDIDPHELFNNVAPLQYLVTAGPTYKRTLILEGFTSIQPDVMAEVRLTQPLRAVASQACVQSKMHFQKLQLSQYSTLCHRILIWQRPILHATRQDLGSIHKLIRNGYIIVIDWDDDPKHWSELQDDDYISFKMVHAIQTSRKDLAHILGQWNPNVKVFSNMIEKLPELPPDRKSLQIHGLRMFFGALNRKKDWSPFIEALNSIFKDDPQFWSASVVHDHAFFEALNLPPSRKSYVPLCAHEIYLREMMSCDFAFLPLLDTPFNRLKSDLKAVEAASCGLAILGSKVVYQECVNSGHTGELFSSSSELLSILESWKTDPDRVFAMGHAARRWVSEQRMAAYQVQEREDWYRQLSSQRDELTSQLLSRVSHYSDSLITHKGQSI